MADYPPSSIVFQSRTRHPAVQSLLGIATRAKPITYKMLISPEATG